MHFCPTCDNMLYLKIDPNDPNKLTHFCRKCGTKHELQATDAASDHCISQTFIKHPIEFSHNINRFIKHDNTIPRVQMKCPNAACKSNQADSAGKNEVLNIRYDEKNMKYVNMCTACNYAW